ncbi:Manganese-transporting ATPase 4, partial [Dictyocoela roeselum]
ILISIAFIFMTRSKTLERVSRARLGCEIVSLYVFLSIFGQCAVHVFFCYLLVLVNRHVNVNGQCLWQDLGSIVARFLFTWSKEFKDLKVTEGYLKEDFKADNEKFTPSLFNTSMFILFTYQQICTFIVNYIGRPYRESLVENKVLRNTILILSLFLVVVVFNLYDEFNTGMEFVDLHGIRDVLLLLMGGDFLLSFLVEGCCRRIFW